MSESGLGPLLRRYRSAAGFTQEELAEKAAVSARTVSDVERGLRTRIYKDTAGRLAVALGLDGSARAGFEATARGRLPSPGSGRASLPIPPTQLIGRDGEVEVILAALERTHVRLLTLTGPGGIGKTRVALEVAAKALPRFSGRVTFVSLGATTDAKFVIPAVASAVEVSGTQDPSIAAIAGRLGNERALLVLDTFEHVLDAAPDVAELLSSSPATVIIVTSREALHLRGEHEVAIPTLMTPSSPKVPDVMDAPATALFIERARAVDHALEIDDETAGIVAEICRRVDGLPLAIELAAARAKHMSLPALRDHLEHRLDVLTGGPRDLPRRQQAMRDTVAWSYELLGAAEQELFRDLSVFAGGWTLDTAVGVCQDPHVLSRLSALVDKSLVFLATETEQRYGMLDVIREYGAELRDTPEIEERHAAYFLSLAEEAEPELGGPAQQDWMRRLARENDNVRTAMRSAFVRKDAETALRLGGAVWRFWLLHGDLSEGRRWLREALDLAPAAAPRARAKVLWGLAWLAYHQGDHDTANECGAEMLRLASTTDDPVEIRNALTVTGIVHLAHLRFVEAILPLERSVDLLRERERGWLLATSMLNLGMATTHAGDPRAEAVLQEALDLYLTLGDRHYGARTVLYLGYAALLGGDPRRSAELFRESLVTFWELEDLWGITEALEAMATISAVDGSHERAVCISGACEVLRKRISARPFPADRAVLDRYLEKARAAIEDRTWHAAHERGCEMTVEEVVDYALAPAT